jgi:Rnl2 family RNA ligase
MSAAARKLFHVGYEKIPDASRKWRASESESREFARLRWCATEKIHGANMSFAVTPHDGAVVACRRRAVIKSNEPFFGYKSWLLADDGAAKQKLVALAALVCDDNDELDRNSLVIRVYGELFGNGYGDDATQRKGAIQSGVYYCDRVQFCVFDVAVTKSDGTNAYLPLVQVMQFCEQVDLLCTEPLLVGTFDGCVHFELPFASTLPARLGMEPLRSLENFAEGIVVRPLDIEMRVGKNVRTLVKVKIDDFLERCKTTGRQTKAESSSTSRTAEFAAIIDAEVRANATRQRVANAISKMGEVESTDLAALKALLRAVKLDIWETIEEDYPDFRSQVDMRQLNILATQVGKQAINDHFANL